jgi:hypothetical protein
MRNTDSEFYAEIVERQKVNVIYLFHLLFIYFNLLFSVAFSMIWNQVAINVVLKPKRNT